MVECSRIVSSIRVVLNSLMLSNYGMLANGAEWRRIVEWWNALV
jgi:hypothetical protein